MKEDLDIFIKIIQGDKQKNLRSHIDKGDLPINRKNGEEVADRIKLFIIETLYPIDYSDKLPKKREFTNGL